MTKINYKSPDWDKNEKKDNRNQFLKFNIICLSLAGIILLYTLVSKSRELEDYIILNLVLALIGFTLGNSIIGYFKSEKNE